MTQNQDILSLKKKKAKEQRIYLLFYISKSYVGLQHGTEKLSPHCKFRTTLEPDSAEFFAKVILLYSICIISYTRIDNHKKEVHKISIIRLSMALDRICIFTYVCLVLDILRIKHMSSLYHFKELGI